MPSCSCCGCGGCTGCAGSAGACYCGFVNSQAAMFVSAQSVNKANLGLDIEDPTKRAEVIKN